MKPQTYCGPIQKKHAKDICYPEFILLYVLTPLVLTVYMQSYSFLMCAFTGALIFEDFGDLQSEPVANVMHSPWNRSNTMYV